MNKIILIGNLGADPDSRTTPAGLVVTRLNVATTHVMKGEKQTEWHRVVAFGKQAEACQNYLTKGSKVAVEGRVQTRKYQDKDGYDRYVTEVIADHVEFLTPRGGAPDVRAAAAGEPSPQAEAPFEDEIPF